MMKFKILILAGLFFAACKPAETENRKPAKSSTSSGIADAGTANAGAGGTTAAANLLGSCHYQEYIGNSNCEDIYQDGLAGRTVQHEKDTCEQSMNGTWQTAKCDATTRVGCSCSINQNGSIYKVMWMDMGTPATTCSQVSLVWKCKLLGS